MNKPARALLLVVIPMLAGLTAHAAVTTPAFDGWFEVPVPSERPAEDETLLAEGRAVYDYRCSPCHGTQGDGEGPAAPYLDPRPRDFTQANYKFRTTVFGELPLDEDLYRTITRGIPGSAMPSWAILSERERWALVAYLKTFSDFFGDEAFDPLRVEDGEAFVLDVPEPPPATPEMVARGRELFVEGKCTDCHGQWGRGDGGSAGTQYTYRKQRILPRDLSKSWRYKGGTGARDLYRTLTGGLNGTPMPSFIGSLNKDDPAQDEADRWAVVHWVRSQQETLDPLPDKVLRVARVSSALPSVADDAAWEEAAELAMPLFGQVIRRPRWQTPAVDMVRVRALHDGTDIAFRLEWHDRTRSAEHSSEEVVAQDTTYPVLDVSEYAHKTTHFADQLALQFATSSDGAARPYLLYGQMDRPVVHWHFRADRPATAPFEERVLRGPGKVKRRPAEATTVTGAAAFEDGRWTMVVRRALVSEARDDVRFDGDGSVPFVVMAWDGGNGESGHQHSLSSWYELVLERPTPLSAWVYGLIALLLAALFEAVWFLRSRRTTR